MKTKMTKSQETMCDLLDRIAEQGYFNGDVPAIQIGNEIYCDANDGSFTMGYTEVMQVTGNPECVYNWQVFSLINDPSDLFKTGDTTLRLVANGDADFVIEFSVDILGELY